LRRWVRYYFFALLLILTIEFIFAVLIVFVAGDVFSISSAILFCALRRSMLLTVLVLQGFVLYQNKKHREVRSKFLTAFTCIHSILFTMSYVILVYQALYNCADHPFFREYTLFLLPLILQAIIFILLAIKKLPVSETIS
jgi:hypothetical protein